MAKKITSISTNDSNDIDNAVDTTGYDNRSDILLKQNKHLNFVKRALEA